VPEASPIVDRLRERLRRTASPAGGWAYYEARNSRIEPTCWALLATASPDNSAAAPHLAFLASLQQPDGLLIELAGEPPNFSHNGLAAWVLQQIGSTGGPDVSRLIAGLTAAKGVKAGNDGSPQDNSLQAWSWVPDTFSWVEPTAWCVLALKKSRAHTPSAAIDARIREAEAMLVNRACREGGWNYGNATILQQDLRPYVPTTALGLLAMSDLSANEAVQRSLMLLESTQLTEPSAFALALTVLALRSLGRDTSIAQQALEDAVARAEARGHLHAIAMAACALSPTGAADPAHV